MSKISIRFWNDREVCTVCGEENFKCCFSVTKSNTAKMLYDDATKFWWDGHSAVAEEFKSGKT